MSPMINARQAAERLGVSSATLHRLATAGTIPTALKGEGLRGQRWFDETDIDAYLASVPKQ